MDSYDLGFWNNIMYPIAPSQVCQSWRSISLSLPHLWAYLSIEASIVELLESFLRCFDVVLHCSCGAPLSISIYHIPPIHLSFEAVAHILAVHSTRWWTLHIISDWPFLMLFRNIKHHLPILKQVYLGFHHGTKTGVIDIFQDAPQLEQVFLYGPMITDISLPWLQIKTFINSNSLVCNGKLNYPIMSESSIIDLRVLNITHQDLLAFWPEWTLQYLKTLYLGCMSKGE